MSIIQIGYAVSDEIVSVKYTNTLNADSVLPIGDVQKHRANDENKFCLFEVLLRNQVIKSTNRMIEQTLDIPVSQCSRKN
jgi:hypothetical protein